MANIKLSLQNFDNRLNDWKNNTGTSRGDVFYYISSEICTADIYQVAWKKNLIIKIEKVDEFCSKITFVDLLT